MILFLTEDESVQLASNSKSTVIPNHHTNTTILLHELFRIFKTPNKNFLCIQSQLN